MDLTLALSEVALPSAVVIAKPSGFALVPASSKTPRHVVYFWNKLGMSGSIYNFNLTII